MEAVTMLKHWSGGGAAAVGATKTQPAATVANMVLGPVVEPGDDGDFFDLEFSVPDEEGEEGGGETDEYSDKEEDDGGEFGFTLCSEGRGGPPSDRSVSLSPTDDLFFKGRLVPLSGATSEPNSKLQFSASFLKSVTRFRVLMLRLKRSKSTAPEPNGLASPKKQQSNGKPFIKVEEVPIISLLARDNSSRSSGGSGRATKTRTGSAPPNGSSEETRNLSKDVMQRYLSKIKPLYVRASKRYNEKLVFSNSGGKPASEAAPTAANRPKGQRPAAGNVPAGLRVVCRRLGKSRSASAAVASVRSPPLPRRRDDSLLQQQDGIQSAIAHCKRSFHAVKGPEAPLARSNSDPGNARTEKIQV